MSPRAAARLEALGFRECYDFAAGKALWFAMGRPIEGELASVLRIGALADRDVPTCSLRQRIGDVADSTRATGWDTAIVVDSDTRVLGRLFADELSAPRYRTVEEAMRSGPSTFRPNVTQREMMRYMDEHDLRTALVTDPDGRLIGLFKPGGEREA